MTEEQIKQHIEKAYVIFVDAKSTFLYSHFLYENSVDLFENLADSSAVPLLDYKYFQLFTISVSLFKQCVIELDKLFNNSSNQKFNLHLFLNGILSNDGLALGFTTALVQGWRTELGTITNERAKVKSLRNTQYAHTDPHYQFFPLPIEALERLFSVAEAIIVPAYGITQRARIIVDLRYRETDLISDITSLANDLLANR